MNTQQFTQHLVDVQSTATIKMMAARDFCVATMPSSIAYDEVMISEVPEGAGFKINDGLWLKQDGQMVLQVTPVTCGYCGSTNCGSLYGDPVCHELP